MQNGFLNSTIGGRRIEHLPCPHPGVPVDLSAPPAGVLHTIEGNLGSGLSVFQDRNARTSRWTAAGSSSSSRSA